MTVDILTNRREKFQDTILISLQYGKKIIHLRMACQVRLLDTCFNQKNGEEK